jgi:hypothetical protein
MSYRVFISHSTSDLGLVYELKQWLEANGIEASVAQLSLSPGELMSERVRQGIAASDCVLVILSQDGGRSDLVNQEVGLAVGSQRLIVPIVEVGLQPKGFLEHREYISFDPKNPVDAINRAVTYLHNQKISKASQEKASGAVLFALGLLALAAVAVSTSDEEKSA